MSTTRPARTTSARTTDLRDEVATAISTGRELGPEFDTEIADSLATRMESETAPKREGEHERPDPATRNARTGKVAGWGALSIAAAAWVAAPTPEDLSWGVLAVIAVVLHVVRTWRS